MKVDWLRRWLVIPYKNSTIRLQGISPSAITTDDELLVQVFSIAAESSNTQTLLPPAISELLQEFPIVVSPPDALPLSQDCDHEIPLVEGARPVTVRPFRYPPALKTGIETQVDTMLQQGIIQPSTSPFNSPVRLVRKKMVLGIFASITATSMP
jgi:hypothetical protein